MSQIRPRHSFSLPIVAALAFLLSFGSAFLVAQPRSASSAGLVQIAVLAGVTGRVTTMDCYDPNPFVAHPYKPGKPNPFPPCRTIDDSPRDTVTGNHGGLVLPTDIGASSGAAVKLQVDYLPWNVRGGYIYLEDASDTFCFNRPPGSTYAGRRTRAYVYYYDQSSSSQHTDYHQILYGHIEQSNLNVWKTWNNVWATNPLWASWARDYYLEGEDTYGMPVGQLSATGSSSCATASHLHQEMTGTHQVTRNTARYSEGCWYVAGQSPELPCEQPRYRWVPGEPVNRAWHDIHYLKIYVH